MRFLVDECTGPAVADWLKSQGHDVTSVFDEFRGIDDDEIIKMCIDDNRVLVTNDKDFGEKVFREGVFHKGVVLIRLEDERSSSKILVLSKLLQSYSNRLSDSFVVVTEKQVRFARR